MASPLKSKCVAIQKLNISLCDLEDREFNSIKDKLELIITEEMINDKQVTVIQNQIDTYIGDEVKKNFVIIIADTPGYAIKYTIKGLCFLTFGTVSIIFFQPQFIDLPKLGKFDFVDDKSDLSDLWECVNLVKAINSTEEDDGWLKRVHQYLIRYHLKNHEKLAKDSQTYEVDLISSLKYFIMVYSQNIYWHFIISKRMDYLVDLTPQDKIFEYDLNFRKINSEVFKSNSKLLLIWKKGDVPTFTGRLKNKIVELILFICLLVIFSCFVICRDYEKLVSLGVKEPHFVKDLVCPNKSELIGFMSLIFFGMVMFRMLFQQIEKKKNAILNKHKKFN